MHNQKASVEAVHVYVDETVFIDPSGQRRCGAGALVVDRPIPETAIASAIAALADDPDRHEGSFRSQDTKTLNRGYFHASEDTKNAHSHLLREINRTFRGRFYYSFGDPDLRGDSAAFRRQIMGNLMVAMKSSEPISVCFERRSGFEREAAIQLVSYMYDGLDWHTYDLPHFPSFYSRVRVEIRDKMEPGLQFADFLLWACVQAVNCPASAKARWHDRIQCQMWAKPGKAPDNEQFGQIRMRPPADAVAPRFNSRSVYPEAVINTEMLPHEPVILYCTAERVVHWAATNELPDHTRHLRPIAQRAWKKLRSSKENATIEQLRDVARVYLRLFDTLPVYSDKDEAGFTWLYKVKLLCALMLRPDQTASISVLDRLCDVRPQVYLNEPQLLNYAEP